MRQVDARTGIQVMDRDECLALLTGEHVGRLAVIHGGSPMIYPVNYVLDGDDIVFGSDPVPRLKPDCAVRCASKSTASMPEPTRDGAWSSPAVWKR